jgi:hypothetical protein
LVGDIIAINEGGSVMSILVDPPAQPILSITETVYSPALNPDIESVVSPVDQSTEMGVAPPVIAIEAVPSDNPHDVTSVPDIETEMAVIWPIVTASDAVQPLASETSTVYVPAVSPVIFCIVPPLDQL